MCVRCSQAFRLLSKVPHAQYRKRFRASYNIFIESNFSGSVGLSKFVQSFLISTYNFGQRKNSLLGQTKKRSLLRLTWLKFLRAGGRSFFLLKIFYTQMRYANLYFSRAGNGNSGSLAARRTSLPESSRPGPACVLDDRDWPRTCNEHESAVSSFFGSSSA